MEKEIQLVISYLDKLAEKLGVGVDQVWPWFIKQQYVEAVVATIILITALVLFVSTVKFVITRWDYEENKYSIVKNNDEAVWVCAFLMVVVFLLFGIANFIAEVPDIFNPEYHALQNIIFVIK